MSTSEQSTLMCHLTRLLLWNLGISEQGNIQNNLNSNSFTRQGVISQLRGLYEMHCWNNYGLKGFSSIKQLPISDAVLQGAQAYYIDANNMVDDDHVGWMNLWITVGSRNLSEIKRKFSAHEWSGLHRGTLKRYEIFHHYRVKRVSLQLRLFQSSSLDMAEHNSTKAGTAYMGDGLSLFRGFDYKKLMKFGTSILRL